MVPVEWFENVQQVWNNCQLTGGVSAVSPSLYNSLGHSDAKLLLSPSYQHCIAGWHRLSVAIIQKSQSNVFSLIENALCIDYERLPCYAEIQANVNDRRQQCLWSDAVRKYHSAVQLTSCSSRDVQLPLKDFDSFIKSVLLKLYCRAPLTLVSCDDDALSSTTHPGPTASSGPHASLMPTNGIIESRHAFYILLPFVRYTLADLLTLSPCRLSATNKQFILYQLLNGVRHLHSRGLSVGDLHLQDIAVDDRLWIHVPPPHVTALCIAADQLQSTLHCSLLSTADHPTPLDVSNLTQADLPLIVHRWVHGEVSNFDYLMFLNHLAGRSVNDPNHYPIMPWVMDFQCRHGGYRDLTRTKYRLNKGDEQLDLTYDMARHDTTSDDLIQTPFHVSDFLSDITYYVYKARRTDKSVLCRLVRHRWVAAHYPASLERLYQWTPDECIPDFYTDASIFTSIHDDLPDLELPAWASNADDFIAAHRSVLEGRHVSENLHHWIDLTFGYKLSGLSAIQSKNVCLQLVDNHQQLLNHGVVQLFTCRHPARFMPSITDMSPSPVSNSIPNKIADSAVELNPLAALESFESVCEFSLSVTHSLPPARSRAVHNTGLGMEDVMRRVRARDMQVVGCLTAELFLSGACWSLYNVNSDGDATGTNNDQCPLASKSLASCLAKRYSLLRSLLCQSEHQLPRSVCRAVKYLLNLSHLWTDDEVDRDTGCLFTFPSAGFDDLPPPDIDILLHPTTSLFHFPDYFLSLYHYLLKYNQLSACRPSTGEELLKVDNDKVSILAQYLTRMSSKLGRDGLEIVIPYVEQLLADLQTSAAQSAWLLFHPIAQVLGPSDTARHFLPALVALFDCDETTVKYLKVYHRSFVIQLIVRLGLETFLTTFSTRLVEAVAGYKDFVVTDTAGGSTDSVDIANRFNHSVDVSRISESDLDGEASAAAADAVFDTESACETDYGAAAVEEDDTSSISGVSVSELATVDIPFDVDGRVHSLTGVQPDLSHFTEDNTSLTDEQLPSVVDPCDGQLTVNPMDVTRLSISAGRNTLQSRVRSTDCNVSSFAADTMKWLAERLGPVLTAKYLSRNLLRMLTLCYIGDDQLKFIESETNSDVSLTRHCVVGDRHAVHVLDCLSHITQLYGQQFLLLQFIQHAKDLVSSVCPAEALTMRGEASIIACLSLLVDTVPDMTDKILLDALQMPLLSDIILPLLRLATNVELSFPSGCISRRIVVYKLLDMLYIVSRRIGFDRTRRDLTEALKIFFNVFSAVHSANLCEPVDEMSCGSASKQQAMGNGSVSVLYQIRVDGETQQLNVDDVKQTHHRQASLTASKQHSLSPTQSDGILSVNDEFQACQDKSRIKQELCETFTAQLAHMTYIPFCRLAGSIHMAEHLTNDDLLRQLCTQHEDTLTLTGELSSQSSVTDTGRGDSVSVEGNKLVMHQQHQLSSASTSSSSVAHSSQQLSESSAGDHRHLRGNWLAYWEHEVGRSDRDMTFRFQQINLQKFTGHTAAVRTMCVLDNENSFVSASKDRTVRLWSLRNCSDGSASVSCQWTYSQHKKPLLDIAFIESVRLMASTDGNLHIWDPFMPFNVRSVSLSKMTSSPGANVSHVVPLPAPSCSLITATNTDTVLRLVDVRTAKFTNELRSTPPQAGNIHCMTVSPDGHTVAVGYTNGVLATIDIRTGFLTSTWKAHETDILDIKALDSRRVATTSLDQTIAVWKTDEGKLLAALKGCNDAVQCMCTYKDTLISASTSNKINVYSSLDSVVELTTTKLKSDVVRGSLSSIAVLPLNRLLLLGTDNGTINLLA